jgi:phage terminase large subunit
MAPATVVTIDYAPRKAFLPFHMRTQRFASIVAHRRAGKTVACVNELIRGALTCTLPEPRFAYVAPFYAQAKDVAWSYLKRFSAKVPGAIPNESELRVDLPNHGRVRLYGADNYDRMRGGYLDGVVLDEYGDMDPRAWPEVIGPMLADRKGWGTFIGTPKGRNAFCEVHERAKSSPDWLALTLRASQTGLIDHDELKRLQSEMTQEQYEQEFECSFQAALVGAFYGKEMNAAEQYGRICAVQYDPAIPVHTAWDLGYKDDTAIWFYQVVRNEIHLIDFYAVSGASIDELATVVSSKPYRYGKHYLPHDARAKTLAANGKSIIEQLAVLLGGVGNLAIVPDLSVQDGIQAARLTLPRCWFDSVKCKDGIEALRQYQREYDDDKKAFRQTPRHDWTSHPADAFRMMAVIWRLEPVATKPDPERVLVVGPENTATLDDAWAMHDQTVSRRQRI